jgi:hypothetical protein
MKNIGRSDYRIKFVDKALTYISKHANLNEPEEVKQFITNLKPLKTQDHGNPSTPPFPITPQSPLRNSMLLSQLRHNSRRMKASANSIKHVNPSPKQFEIQRVPHHYSILNNTTASNNAGRHRERTRHQTTLYPIN